MCLSSSFKSKFLKTTWYLFSTKNVSAHLSGPSLWVNRDGKKSPISFLVLVEPYVLWSSPKILGEPYTVEYLNRRWERKDSAWKRLYFILYKRNRMRNSHKPLLKWNFEVFGIENRNNPWNALWPYLSFDPTHTPVKLRRSGDRGRHTQCISKSLLFFSNFCRSRKGKYDSFPGGMFLLTASI